MYGISVSSVYAIGHYQEVQNASLYPLYILQRIREDMTLRFQKQEVGSWKLEVGFSQLRSLERKRLVDLGTATGTKLAKSNFQLPTSNFLFLKTEGHVFSNPL